MALIETPRTERALLCHCELIEGMTLGQLAMMLGLSIPKHSAQRKGFSGKMIELALGTTAGNASSPDFCALGIELKTVPINHLGKPAESTFVTTISLLTIHQETWKTSYCFSKLRRVLWVPIEGDPTIPFAERRIGRPVLWSPSSEEEEILSSDWSELVCMISTGRLSEIDARMGDYLQVRPKAADARSLCYGVGESGDKELTLPRGFYLRTCFTEKIVGYAALRSCL